MDWLFDNLGKLAPVVVFLLYMIGSLKGKGQEKEQEIDPQAAERARKIQEEIRRKILERQRGDGPVTGRPPEAESVFERESEPEVVFDEEELSRSYAPPIEEKKVSQMFETRSSENSYAERRKAIEEKLAATERMKEVAMQRANTIRDTFRTTHRRSAGSSSVHAALVKGLSSPDALKSSVLLREILDKPVGMR